MMQTFKTRPFQFMLDHIIDYVFVISFFLGIPLFLTYLYFVPETPDGLVITPLFFVIMGGGLLAAFLSVYLIGIFHSQNVSFVWNSSSGRYEDARTQRNISVNSVVSAAIRTRILGTQELLKTDLPSYTLRDAVEEAPQHVPKPKLLRAYNKSLSEKFGYDVNTLGDYWIEINTTTGIVCIPADSFDSATRREIVDVLQAKA